MTKVRGSLTIEAAIILPLVLLLFGAAMDGGIQMYTECRDTAVSIAEEKEIDTVKLFYRFKALGDITGNED